MPPIHPTASNAAEQALLDYLDGLLHEAGDASLDLFAEPAAKVRLLDTAASAKVTPLDVARGNRPARVVEPVRTFSEPHPLTEPRSFAEPRTFAEPRPFAEPARALSLRMPVPPVAPEPPPPMPVVEAPITAPPPVVTPAPVARTPTAPPVAEVEPAAETQTEGGRPAWSEQPFECLLFKAGGLTLAVPLVELGSIFPFEADDLTEIFGQIDWFLGLMQTKYGNLRVVDTAQVVMPERYRAEMAAGYHFVVSLADSDWGLGVDEIVGTTLMDPEAVRWRGARGKRPWLAGTIIERMCALLDVGQLGRMFDSLDRKRTT